MKERQATKVYRDKGKMLGALALMILFCVGLSAWLLQNAGTSTVPLFKQDLLWLADVFLAIFIVAFVAMILDRRPYLTFTDQGLVAISIASDMIPWSAVKDARLRTYKRSKFLELEIDPNVVRGLRPNFIQSKLRYANMILGFPHYTTSASTLDHDADFLLQLFIFYLQKNKNPERQAP